MKEKILQKIDSLMLECEEVREIAFKHETDMHLQTFNDGSGYAKFRAFRSSSLSFLNHLLGSDNIYYKNFDGSVVHFNSNNLLIAFELFKSIRKDVDEGWLINIKGIISAEIFSDFLEMAEHLLDENYKDPAAVVIGSVLEESLRDLCSRNGIPITSVDTKSGKVKPNKAETINVDLCKAGIYNGLTQKSVTAWLDLRNKAAHGHYKEYDLQQVKILLQSVRDFAMKFL